MRSRSVVPKLGTLLAIGLLAGPVLGAEPPLSDAAREELQQSLLPTEARSVSVEVPMARLGFDAADAQRLAVMHTRNFM